jgi:hypothetical protein
MSIKYIENIQNVLTVYKTYKKVYEPSLHISYVFYGHFIDILCALYILHLFYVCYYECSFFIGMFLSQVINKKLVYLFTLNPDNNLVVVTLFCMNKLMGQISYKN